MSSNIWNLINWFKNAFCQKSIVNTLGTINNLKLAVFMFIFLQLVTYGVFAETNIPNADSVKVKRIGILPVPAFGYSPETGIYFGAVTLFTLNLHQNRDTRTSNAKLEFNYSLKNQKIFESAWDYYFPHENWYSRGVIHSPNILIYIMALVKIRFQTKKSVLAVTVLFCNLIYFGALARKYFLARLFDIWIIQILNSLKEIEIPTPI